MPKIGPLTPDQARATFTQRFAPVADRLRQISTNFGTRPYRVFIVHLQAAGQERLEGKQTVISSVELLPTPKVIDLTNVALSPFGAGTIPVGSVRLEKISNTYTFDFLTGRMTPQPHEDFIPDRVSWFYELVEDGRGDPNPVRMKFRPISQPFRRPGKEDWTVVLGKLSEDRDRGGNQPFPQTPLSSP